MSAEGILIAFFLFTLMAVAAAGYVFVLKPSRAGGTQEIATPLALTQPDLPAPQAAVQQQVLRRIS